MLVNPTAYQDEKVMVDPTAHPEEECEEADILERSAFIDHQSMTKLQALREAHNEEVDRTDQRMQQWLDRLDRYVDRMGGRNV